MHVSAEFDTLQPLQDEQRLFDTPQLAQRDRDAIISMPTPAYLTGTAKRPYYPVAGRLASRMKSTKARSFPGIWER